MWAVQRTSASVLCETGRTWKDFSRRILYLWGLPRLPGATSFPSERGRWFPVSPGFFRAKHVPWQNPVYLKPWGSVSSEYQELNFWRTASVQKAKEMEDHEYLLCQDRESCLLKTCPGKVWSKAVAPAFPSSLFVTRSWSSHAQVPILDYGDSTQEGRENDLRETYRPVGLTL